MSERDCDSGANMCNVKYIHLDPAKIDPDCAKPVEFHEAIDYEFCMKPIRHNDFADMHRKVVDKCPNGFECREPLALFHEVMWSCGSEVDEESGERRWVRLERDRLRHAIEKDEYNILWPDGKADGETLSICVDIERQTQPCVPAEGVMMLGMRMYPFNTNACFHGLTTGRLSLSAARSPDRAPQSTPVRPS
jgi:hypothetical protein